ncbi:hypothetical protein BH10ACI4_BH10ACI4_24650 [soil metagenome]
MSLKPSRLVLLLLLGSTVPMLSQQAERPPSMPLIVHDPYFSVWSNTDKLTDSATRHWTGHPQPLGSLVRVDGKPYRIMGKEPSEVPAMEQVSARLTPTHTRYSFSAGGVQIDLAFFTPAFLDNLDLLSRPVTYVTWTAHATDGAQHQVAVLLAASPEIATSMDRQEVVFSRHQTAATSTLSVGTRDQAVLNRSGDDLRIDWGFFNIAVPNTETSKTTISVRPDRAFAKDGALPTVDAMEGPVSMNRSAPQMAVMLPFDSVGTRPVAKHILVSYTEGYAIQMLGQNLRPYWQRDNKPVGAMLDEAERDYEALDARGNDFDKRLVDDLTKSAGEHYAWLCTLAYRQAIAAHKLVADQNGAPMLFAKENFSNGDIATVDVLYPSAPIFLFFNPKLLEAQMLPVLQYAAMKNRWRFPFAPHDLGQYPLANGQDYGGGEKTEENQMPVEESGNLLILVDAFARAEGNASLAQRFWPQLTQWAEYLLEKGLDPENQLSTDDFAGHLAHNANLSIKAIDALAAYANLAKTLHHDEEAKKYAAAAKGMAQKWIGMAKEGDHYKLAFDATGTWSQKYNLVWDKLLDYNLFPKSVRDTEITYYQTKLNTFGLPLDSRKSYTKLDWELWTATLADEPAAFNALVDPVYRWANETTSRVPMTDWYDTQTGVMTGFQARSVVGGVFIKALADKPLVKQWRAGK